MDTRLISALAIVAALTACLTVVLVAIKLTHRGVQRWRGVRSAHYVAAVGEIVSRRMIPSNPPVAWTSDPQFHDAVIDYKLLLSGDDRRFVDGLVDRLEIADHLITRAKRRFPASSRLRAVSSLVSLAEGRHLEDLRALLADRNPHVRVNTVRALARLGDAESVPTVLDLATRAEPWEAARMADSLVEMGQPAVAPLRAWVEQEANRPGGSVEVVALAARLLGLIGDPDAEPTLICLLASSQVDWRVAAASALEHAGSDSAIEPLRRALADDEWQVRARAATALSAMAHPGVASEVAQLLTDENWWVRQNSASALDSIPGGQAMLIAALDGPDRFAADAALNQLTMSGAFGEATERLRNGAGTEADRSLLAKATKAQ
ncbi:hypothetical protein BH23ACT5_BH23ACT5_07480 [soil metagenome]